MTAVTVTQITPLEFEALIENTFRKLIKEGSIPNAQPQLELLMTIQQAAEFLNLAVTTVYGLTSRNELPFMKKGKRLYFSKSDLLKYLESGKNKTAKEIEQGEENRLCISAQQKISNQGQQLQQ